MTDHDLNIDRQQSELDWLAFCYVSDELSSDECSKFEARLAESQLARDAVTRAVQLTVHAAAALTLNTAVKLQTREVSEAKPSRSAGRFSVAAVVLAVLATGWLIAGLSAPETEVIVESENGRIAGSVPVPPVEGEIVRLWADSDDQEPGESNQSGSPGAVDLSDTEVPDWLVAALLTDNDSDAVLSEPAVLDN